MKNLNQKIFTNNFVENFNGQELTDSPPRQTPGYFYAKSLPEKTKKPNLIGWSNPLAKELKLCPPNDSDIKILSGNLVTSTMTPYASRYGGHQFGHWAGQLGDGRAMTLGELHNQDLQLKGAGLTAYSRHADGKAVLRSSVREYLMSEAMYHLGIPTTRALSLTETGDSVLRDMFYDGNQAYERGAVVARVAPSFIRFGNFEILFYQNDFKGLKQLADWTIEHHYSHIKIGEKNYIAKFFKEVSLKTAQMIIHWMRVGFTHGVMNTDNMSILGLTIDYGPFSMLDEYDPNFTPNTSDLPGRRYAFSRQASISLWNLHKLALALSPLVDDAKELEIILEEYQALYRELYLEMLSKKLGLKLEENEENMHFLNELELLQIELKIDYTLFYIALSNYEQHQNKLSLKEELIQSSYVNIKKEEEHKLISFIENYEILKNKFRLENVMNKVNPRFILKNFEMFRATEALNQDHKDHFQSLEKLIQSPYTTDFESHHLKKPNWTDKERGACMLSCSS